MVYVSKTKLPENKSVFYALISLYGIGRSRACLICHKLGFSGNLKIRNLTKKQVNILTKIVDDKLMEDLNFELLSNLKKSRRLAKKKLISIKSYKGIRRAQGLPIRGQRTHTNARTSRKKYLLT
jgi:small subunit ribosomal protein S13